MPGLRAKRDARRDHAWQRATGNQSGCKGRCRCARGDGGVLCNARPGTPRSKEAFWGVLATREDHRGRGLAGWLGARAIQHMWEYEGMRGFNTGIKEDNAASLAACAKLGIRRSDLVTLFCFDDATLSEGPRYGRALNPANRTTQL